MTNFCAPVSGCSLQGGQCQAGEWAEAGKGQSAGYAEDLVWWAQAHVLHGYGTSESTGRNGTKTPGEGLLS